MKKYILIFAVMFAAATAVNGQVNAADFVQIASGSFTMGNTAYTRESPTKTINLGAFYLTKNVITNSQYATFLNAYGSTTVKAGEFAGKTMFVADSWGVVNNNGVWAAATGYENFPMIKVTWYGADEFCKYYSGRLPTEAEWEYAAKGGKTQSAFTYSGSSTATSVAWFYDNSGHLNKAVGTKAANTAGLYDMSGNVYQWCSDWYGRYADFGATGDSNPAGPDAGVSKVIRGGYRSLGSTDLHLTHRESISPDESYNFVGFRMVKNDLSAGLIIPEADICVYPNPASEFLNVKNSDKVSKIDIVYCQGRLVFQTVNQTDMISLADFTNGMYFVKVKSAGNLSIQKVVIKH